jgi:hypothetical protein
VCPTNIAIGSMTSWEATMHDDIIAVAQCGFAVASF